MEKTARSPATASLSPFPRATQQRAAVLAGSTVIVGRCGKGRELVPAEEQRIGRLVERRDVNDVDPIVGVDVRIPDNARG